MTTRRAIIKSICALVVGKRVVKATAAPEMIAGFDPAFQHGGDVAMMYMMDHEKLYKEILRRTPIMDEAGFLMFANDLRAHAEEHLEWIEDHSLDA